MLYRGSKKTSQASSNETSCFRAFASALSEFQVNTQSWITCLPSCLTPKPLCKYVVNTLTKMFPSFKTFSCSTSIPEPRPRHIIFKTLTWHCSDSGAVQLNDVLGLAYDLKPSLLQSTDGSHVVYPRDFTHGATLRPLSHGRLPQGTGRLRPPGTRGSRP